MELKSVQDDIIRSGLHDWEVKGTFWRTKIYGCGFDPQPWLQFLHWHEKRINEARSVWGVNDLSDSDKDDYCE